MTRHIHEHKCNCGKCDDYVCPRGWCWCEDNRDPIATIESQFPSPVCDSSDGSFWREEVDILRVLYEAHVAGESSPLIESRGYVQDADTYGVSWYWENKGMSFPTQWDGPVIRLWSRLMVRPVRCAGGKTWIILSDAALSAIKELAP